MMNGLHLLWVWGGYAGILLVSLFAFRRGGWAERSAAAAILFTWVLTPLVQNHFDPTVLGIAIDGATGIVLTAISLKSRRIWSLFAAASVWGAFTCHFMAGVFSQIGYFSYITALGLLGGIYLIIGLGIGVLEHQFLQKHRHLLRVRTDG